ncbi:MAG TPA: hypothetical protein PLW12_09280, partial [Methanothrix sp.]|nr:hypothetical protein [Methanothrix sp.]
MDAAIEKARSGDVVEAGKWLARELHAIGLEPDFDAENTLNAYALLLDFQKTAAEKLGKSYDTSELEAALTEAYPDYEPGQSQPQPQQQPPVTVTATTATTPTSATGSYLDTIEKSLSRGDFFLMKKAGNRVVQQFSPTLATQSILKKFDVAISADDEKRETLYLFDGQVWQPNGKWSLLRALNRIGQDDVNRFSREEVLNRLRIEAPLVKFNQNPCLYPTEDALLDLARGEVGPYQKDDYLTFKVPIKFDPAGDYRPFLWHLCSTLPDAETVLQAIDVTCSMLLRVPFTAIALLQGPGGNGKSVFVKTLIALTHPDRYTAIPFHEVKGSRFGLGAILGKDLWIIDEVETAANVLNILKRVATGDAIDSDVKYSGRVKGIPHALPVLDSNHTIDLGDLDRGVLRRILKFDFPYKFGDGKYDRPKDENWGEFLTRPEHLSGILRIALARCPVLYKTRQVHRRYSEEELKELHQRQQHSAAFFCEEVLTTDKGEALFLTSLEFNVVYTEYLEYCRLFRVPDPLDRSPLGKYIRKKFDVSTVPQNGKRIFSGLYLRRPAYGAFLDSGLRKDYSSIQEIYSKLQEIY